MTAVVVAYESASHIEACIRALEDDGGGELDVVVIDNASQDSTVAIVRENFPSVSVRVMHRNLGYGAAANIGIRLATGDPLLILNADAVIERGTIVALCDRLRDDPQLGCVSPMHITSDGNRQSPARACPSIGSAIVDGTMAERWLRGSAVLRAYYRDGVDPGVPPDWLDGACLAFRSKAMDEVGGFDAGYFMYSEEIDLFRALRHAGWACAVESHAAVRHAGGGSSDRDLVARECNFFRSRYRLVGKIWGHRFAAFLRILVALMDLARLAEQLLKAGLAKERDAHVIEAQRIARVTLWQWFGWRN